jgi:IS30 family transposase
MTYEKQREEIKKLLLKEIDYREIAKSLGCAINTVVYQSNVSGIPITKKEKKGVAFLREYRTLLKQKVSKEDIAKLLMKKFELSFESYCVYRYNSERKIALSK